MIRYLYTFDTNIISSFANTRSEKIENYRFLEKYPAANKTRMMTIPINNSLSKESVEFVLKSPTVTPHFSKSPTSTVNLSQNPRELPTTMDKFVIVCSQIEERSLMSCSITEKLRFTPAVVKFRFLK